MLNFYANPLSPYATKVHFFLEEAGLPYKYHAVNAQDPKGRELLDKVSPFGKVPAIEHGGFHLSESGAILRYLTARFDLHALYPTSLEERAQVDMTLDFAQLHVSRWLVNLAWHLSVGPKFGMACNDASVAEAQSNLPVPMQRLERWLGEHSYLAGPDFSLADISAYPFLAQHKMAHVSLSDYPNLAAYIGRVGERPAWKKTAADTERRIGEMMAHR